MPMSVSGCLYSVLKTAAGMVAMSAPILDAWISDEYPGWSDVVDRLERSGVETALLSNTNAFHWEYLVPEGSKAGRYPAIGRLRHRFASHQLGMVKPNPQSSTAPSSALPASECTCPLNSSFAST